MPATTSPTQGVVLSGGGSRAAYEVGVLKALISGNVPGTTPPAVPDIYSGTSGGAFNAALMASSRDENCLDTVARCESVWLSSLAGRGRFSENGAYRLRGNLLDLFDSARGGHQASSPTQILFGDQVFLFRELWPRLIGLVSFDRSIDERISDLVDLSAFFDTSPMEKAIRECIALEEIHSSPRRLYVATTDWATGRLKVFAKEDFQATDAYKLIMASCALPGVFPPVEIGGELYQDGGVIMNTPLKPAIDAGAEVLYAIYMDPDPGLFPTRKLRTSLDVVTRALAINAASIMNNDIERAAQVNRIIAIKSQYPAMTPGTILALEGRSPDQTPHRVVTIHRFHPNTEFGGLLGALDFGIDNIRSLIKQGFDDASRHDCRAAHCVLPT